MNPIITVLHEDNHVLGVLKPAGLLAQGDRTGDPTALAQVREYIRVTYGKPGEAFVGLVHRIDRPVSGVMVFARTSKAASRLARAFHDRTVEKTYLAVVIGEMPAARGDLAGFVARDHTRSRMTYATGRARATRRCPTGCWGRRAWRCHRASRAGERSRWNAPSACCRFRRGPAATIRSGCSFRRRDTRSWAT
jgi:23S rRNA-/tRNA-specific pseudouridylate synthase